MCLLLYTICSSRVICGAQNKRSACTLIFRKVFYKNKTGMVLCEWYCAFGASPPRRLDTASPN